MTFYLIINEAKKIINAIFKNTAYLLVNLNLKSIQ